VGLRAVLDAVVKRKIPCEGRVKSYGVFILFKCVVVKLIPLQKLSVYMQLYIHLHFISLNIYMTKRFLIYL